MDIVATIILGLSLSMCCAYIIKERFRREKQSKAVETNYNIKVSIIFYSITVVLIIGYILAYYLNAYPTAQPIVMFLTSLVFLLFPFISYGLSRKRIIATNDKVEVYTFFNKKTIAIQKITKIKNYTLTSKIYVGDKVLISMDRRFYDNHSQFLRFVKEKSKCKEE